MKKILFLLTGIILLSGCLSPPDEQSHSKRKYPDVKVSRLIRVYDGDTFICDIDELPPLIGKNIRVRLKHINTPELGAEDKIVQICAFAEKNRLEQLLNSAKIIELRNIDRDKFFRIVADVYVDDKPLLSNLNPQYKLKQGGREKWNSN